MQAYDVGSRNLTEAQEEKEVKEEKEKEKKQTEEERLLLKRVY